MDSAHAHSPAIALAERFLQEAVYRSRALQAAETAVMSGEPNAAGCGLGARAAITLDLSDRGRELFAELFPAELTEERVSRIRDVMREWIRGQDVFDRRRNHFLKDFRQRHGFDRRTYSSELADAYGAGLAEINAEVSAALRAAAERLLAAR